MNFNFYGYAMRTTNEADALRAFVWTKEGDYRFWLRQGIGRENFLVSKLPEWVAEFPVHLLRGEDKAEPLAFVQIEQVAADQARIHFQASPIASPKKLLRGITLLVPLMEKALALRGVRVIFFTTHSLRMGAFMEKLGYQWQINVDGGADGRVMAKKIAAAVSRTGQRQWPMRRAARG